MVESSSLLLLFDGFDVLASPEKLILSKITCAYGKNKVVTAAKSLSDTVIDNRLLANGKKNQQEAGRKQQANQKMKKIISDRHSVWQHRHRLIQFALVMVNIASEARFVQFPH